MTGEKWHGLTTTSGVPKLMVPFMPEAEAFQKVISDAFAELDECRLLASLLRKLVADEDCYVMIETSAADGKPFISLEANNVDITHEERAALEELIGEIRGEDS